MARIVRGTIVHEICSEAKAQQEATASSAIDFHDRRALAVDSGSGTPHLRRRMTSTDGCLSVDYPKRERSANLWPKRPTSTSMSAARRNVASLGIIRAIDRNNKKTISGRRLKDDRRGARRSVTICPTEQKMKKYST